MKDPAWFFFLLATLFSVLVQALFALFEMASLSVNRIRLQYYSRLGKKRALWLSSLLENPSRFFGTALIGINAALQVGSECSRKFYESIHLDPDLAPITQVFLVVIFGELVPMLIARRSPSDVALFLAPLMAVISRLLQPIIFLFDGFWRFLCWMMGIAKVTPLFVSREEIMQVFEEEGHDELRDLTRRVFQLKSLSAGSLMIPLQQMIVAPVSATVEEVEILLKGRYMPVMAVYRFDPKNIIALVHTRDLLRLSSENRVIEKGRSPWFITQDASILSILEEFRRNNQSAAIVLDSLGGACGLLTLDHILANIFGEEPQDGLEEEHAIYVERTLSGEMPISDFNREFQAELPLTGTSLSELVVGELGHLPGIGESVRIGSFVFTVLEPTLLGVKTLIVRSEQE